MMMFQQPHFHFQLIARHNAPAEPGLVDPGQHKEAAALANDTERENRGGLRQRFEKQHPRHDRHPREMTAEERFVDRDVFQRQDALTVLLKDTVDQQERIAMRQQAEETPGIAFFFRRHGPLYLVMVEPPPAAGSLSGSGPRGSAAEPK